MKILWIIVSCHTLGEAKTIGDALMKARRAASYRIIPSVFYRTFWPPKKNKRISMTGAMLIATSLQRHVSTAKKIVVKKHHDRVPFVGVVPINDVSQDYYKWLSGELTKHV